MVIISPQIFCIYILYYLKLASLTKICRKEYEIRKTISKFSCDGRITSTSLYIRSLTSYIRATRLCVTQIAFTDFVVIILVTTTSYEPPCYAVFSILLFLTPSSRNTALSQTHSVSALSISRKKMFTFDIKERGNFTLM